MHVTKIVQFDWSAVFESFCTCTKRCSVLFGVNFWYKFFERVSPSITYEKSDSKNKDKVVDNYAIELFREGESMAKTEQESHGIALWCRPTVLITNDQHVWIVIRKTFQNSYINHHTLLISKQLRSVTYHMGSHSVTCYPTQVNTLRLHPSQTGWYSIYLPRRDGRLSCNTDYFTRKQDERNLLPTMF